MGVEQQEFGEDDDEICVVRGGEKKKLKNVYHHVLGNQENP